MKKFFLSFAILFLSLSGFLTANPDNSSATITNAISLSKHYINFNQLFFAEEGIFLQNDSGEQIPISSLFYDEEGYYTLDPIEKFERCPHGHPISTMCKCGGCVDPFRKCPWRCLHQYR